MPAIKTRLSAKKLTSLEAGDLAWDTEVKGFGARKAKDGGVSLFLNYQQRDTGKYKRIAIGKLGECSVDEARKRAATMRLEIRAGVNVAQQVETAVTRARSGEALGDYVNQWLDSPKHGWSDKTRYDYTRMMKRHLLESDTAASRIQDVTRADLMKLVDAATDVSASGGALFYRTLSSFLGWADDRELTTVTLPKAKRVAPAPAPRQRVITDDELRKLWHAADCLTPLTAACGKLLLLTGQRSGAVQRLHRDWVTQEGVTWPADVMKAKRAHFTPLNPWAYESIHPVLDRDGFAFGENTNRLNLAWRKQWRKAAAVDEDLRMHDVRRSLRTWAAAKGFGHDASEAALAHSVQRDALSQAYQQHTYEDEAAEVLRGWQTHLKEVVA